MRSIEQLAEEILSLPSESRALLADKLVESLEFDADSEIQAVWVTEAKRRRDEVRDGSVQPIPGEDALAQIRRLIELSIHIPSKTGNPNRSVPKCRCEASELRLENDGATPLKRSIATRNLWFIWMQVQQARLVFV